MQYPSSELVLDSKGNVYHLGIAPKNIASTVILVGDPNRVEAISSFFDKIEFKSSHREFVCHTGTYKGKKITALSTGIGTDNIDIVMNELDALVNIDLSKRENKQKLTSLTILRIGTCGILQKEIPLHSYIVSTHAIGIDNVAHFYPIAYSETEKKTCSAFATHCTLPKAVIPYCASASIEIVGKLNGPLVHKGITVTSSGFYAPQGRSLRLGSKTDMLNEQLESFSYGGENILNFEMESSALFALGKAMGHKCGTICLGIANRSAMQFSKDYKKEMNDLIHFVLETI